MFKYLFGTGIFGSIVSGATMLRSLREGEFTWRTALAWLSWGITAALAVGAVTDMWRARHGKQIAADSPINDVRARKRERALRRLNG